MDSTRSQRLARQILADILSVGSAVSAGPVWSAEQEAEVLDVVAVRLHALLQHHGHESDPDVTARFRAEHPDLFAGTAAQRHRAARAKGSPPTR